MRVNFVSAPIAPSFKGLWEAKEKDFNNAGLGYVSDIDCVYHPFKDEDIKGNEKELSQKAPESFIYQPSPELLRTYYSINFSIGDKLNFTKEEFEENKADKLSELDGIYSETPDGLDIESNFDFRKETADIMKEIDDFQKNATPEEKANARRLLDELVNDEK